MIGACGRPCQHGVVIFYAQWEWETFANTLRELGRTIVSTLWLVPVLYSLFVLDLKIFAWGKVEAHEPMNIPFNPKAN